MNIVNNILNIRIFRDSIYYKVVFVLWGLVHSLTMGQYITGYFSIPMIAWGGILVLRNLFAKKGNINKVTLFSIYTFLISYVITIILNMDSNLVGNTKTLIWQFIMLLVLFISEGWKKKEDIIRDILVLCKAIIISTIILSSISLALFFLNINFEVARVDGRLIPQGYFHARLWGIYVDPNQASVIAQISILSSAIIMINKRNIKKTLYITNIVIQYIFMVLTASRGGEIAFGLSLIALGYLLFDYLLRNKINKEFFRTVSAFFIAILVAIGILYSAAPTRNLLVKIPNFSGKVRNQINSSTNLNIGSVTENVVVDRTDLESSNGRVELWKDGLRLSKFSPVFGFGDRNIPVKADELTPGSTLVKKTVHNGFIHMLLSGGIVAVGIMLVIIISVAFTAVKVFFSKVRYNSEYLTINITSIMIGVLLATSVFLTEIFYQNSFAAAVFWILMGYNVYLCRGYLKANK